MRNARRRQTAQLLAATELIASDGGGKASPDQTAVVWAVYWGLRQHSHRGGSRAERSHTPSSLQGALFPHLDAAAQVQGLDSVAGRVLWALARGLQPAGFSHCVGVSGIVEAAFDSALTAAGVKRGVVWCHNLAEVEAAAAVMQGVPLGALAPLCLVVTHSRCSAMWLPRLARCEATKTAAPAAPEPAPEGHPSTNAALKFCLAERVTPGVLSKIREHVDALCAEAALSSNLPLLSVLNGLAGATPFPAVSLGRGAAKAPHQDKEHHFWNDGVLIGRKQMTADMAARPIGLAYAELCQALGPPQRLPRLPGDAQILNSLAKANHTQFALVTGCNYLHVSSPLPSPHHP